MHHGACAAVAMQTCFQWMIRGAPIYSYASRCHSPLTRSSIMCRIAIMDKETAALKASATSELVSTAQNAELLEHAQAQAQQLSHSVQV